MGSLYILDPCVFQRRVLERNGRDHIKSEGQNSFFGRYLSPTASLVEFFSHFDSAIDVQRQIQLKLNADCDDHYLELKTPLLLEQHASVVYTITVFHEVQKEIYAGCFFRRLVSIKACGDIITYDIKEDDVRLFTVHYSSIDNSATCSCTKFQRVGTLCRHIFMVYKDARIDNIPDAYIVCRWTRGVCLPQVFGLNG